MKEKYQKFLEKHSPRYPNTTLPEDYKLDDIDQDIRINNGWGADDADW